MYNDYPTSIPATSYTLVIRVTDAGGSTDTINFTVNFEANVTAVSDRIWRRICGQEQYPSPYDYTTIKVEDWAESGKNGYYVYNGDWAGLSSGGGTIKIDHTNANIGSGCSGNWFFTEDTTPSGLNALELMWADCKTCQGSNDSNSGVAVDFSSEVFTIV